MSSRRAALASLARRHDGCLPQADELKEVYRKYADPLAAPGSTADHPRIVEEELALLDMRQVCLVEDVIVEGEQAVWIFSERETEETLHDLVAWLTPDNWPNWSSVMFKAMRPVGPRTVVVPASERGEQSRRAEVPELHRSHG